MQVLEPGPVGEPFDLGDGQLVPHRVHHQLVHGLAELLQFPYGLPLAVRRVRRAGVLGVPLQRLHPLLQRTRRQPQRLPLHPQHLLHPRAGGVPGSGAHLPRQPGQLGQALGDLVLLGRQRHVVGDVVQQTLPVDLRLEYRCHGGLGTLHPAQRRVAQQFAQGVVAEVLGQVIPAVTQPGHSLPLVGPTAQGDDQQPGQQVRSHDGQDERFESELDPDPDQPCLRCESDGQAGPHADQRPQDRHRQ
ncbi:hypothetical protein [Streptomyces rochei]|uniref:hypothetical protein n=1 Tax=Streptomyces rochei TaxID=1928 RepID=UPI0036FF0851